MAKEYTHPLCKIYLPRQVRNRDTVWKHGYVYWPLQPKIRTDTHLIFSTALQMPCQILDLLDPTHVLSSYTMKSLDNQGTKSPISHLCFVDSWLSFHSVEVDTNALKLTSLVSLRSTPSLLSHQQINTKCLVHTEHNMSIGQNNLA